MVGNDRANAAAARLGREVVTLVPVTSNVSWVPPFQVLLRAREGGLPRGSEARAEQVGSVTGEQLAPVLGLATSELHALDDALRLHLNL